MKNDKLLERFGPVWGASGVQGFFGEGYWFTRWLKFLTLGLSSSPGATFVAKTVTLNRNEGNMRLREDGITPVEWFPECIIVKWWKGIALNAVGLSNFGIEFYLNQGRWQGRRKPYFLSFMPVGKTAEEREGEMKQFVSALNFCLHRFSAKIGLHLNLSCPNTEVDLFELTGKTLTLLDIASELQIPLVVKLNVLVPVKTALTISQHPACDGICISNTIPYGQLRGAPPYGIDWKKLFGSDASPLAADFGISGGLSGQPLLPIVAKWVREAREAGITKHINAGGGILWPWHAWKLYRAGADSISIGSMAFLRPWNIQPTIWLAHLLFK